MQIQLIWIRDSPDHRSVRNKGVKLYELTLRGRDLVSVVRIIESPHCRGFFLKKMYENFVGTLENVLNIEVSVPSGSTVFEFLTQS